MPEDTLETTRSNENATPVVLVISDARGKTAASVVEAAADQFDDGCIQILRLGNVKTVDMVAKFLDDNIVPGVPVAVFHTIVNRNLRRDIRRELDGRGVPSIDLLGPAITIISTLTDTEPKYQAGRRSNNEAPNVQ